MSRIKASLAFQADRLRKTELPVRAAALAYHSVLAVVPAFGLVLWSLNAAGVGREWRIHIRDYILSHLNVASSQAFVEQFSKLTSSVGGKGWGTLTALFLVYSTFNLVQKSGESLDLVIDSSVEEPRFRPRYMALFARRLLVMILLPIVLSFSLVVSIWLHREAWFRELFAIHGKTTLLTTPSAWLITIVGVYAFYQFVPARPVKTWAALRAALVAGPCLEIAKLIMTQFSSKALAVQKVYGAMAAIPFLILWTQIVWMVLLTAAFLIRPKTPNQDTRFY